MNTHKLTGVALDWAVTSIEEPDALKYGVEDWLDKRQHETRDGFFVHRYSTVWAQGGEIIEREGMQLWKGGQWCASLDQSFNPPEFSTGDTPLVAVMRCYVASKLGSEVDIPEELLTKETV
jgi:hypothetical protein